MSDVKESVCTSESERTAGRDARGVTLDLAGALGLLATTIGRARELPGRIGDATKLRSQLGAYRDELEVRLAQAECEAATSRRLGREFSARRARGEAQALREEIADTTAMLDEVERVFRRLRREVRTLGHRLTMCASLVDDLPSDDERDRAVALIARARAALEADSTASARRRSSRPPRRPAQLGLH